MADVLTVATDTPSSTVLLAKAELIELLAVFESVKLPPEIRLVTTSEPDPK